MIGGGIMGAASAAYLAEAGLSVRLFEEAAIGAGASGRNSGAIQRPGDGPFAELQVRSLDLYRQQELVDQGFRLAPQPNGLLIVSADEAALATLCDRLAIDHGELSPALHRAGDAHLRQSGLADDVAACRLQDGFPVAPAVATESYARRARRAGVRFTIGEHAVPEMEGAAVMGVRLAGGQVVPAGQVLVAAGPWTPALVPGWSELPPIAASWGVVVGTTLPEPPGPVLEELGIEARGGPSDTLFSLVSADGASSVGSTFLRERPDPDALADQIMRRAARFVPALAAARAQSVRLCARPVSFDGRPLIGRVPGVAQLFVCAGHGPWGISTGPASARLVADVMLGVAETPAVFDPSRWPVGDGR